MPWIGVTTRFSRFDGDLQPTIPQVEDAQTKQLNVRKCLQATYYGPETDNPPGLIIGSWGKRTPVRPSADIDILFPIPTSEWDRINGYAGNSQSILLQEVKGVVAERYGSTDLRGDGQVVQVKFNSIMVEIVPAFPTDDPYKYAMPDTHDGGRWKPIFPVFEQVTIDFADTDANGNVVRLSRMMKHWKRFKKISIKSYIVELLIADFFKPYSYKHHSFFYFDWFVRDFLRYLIGRANTTIYSPGSGEFVPLGNDWLYGAKLALVRAEAACELEYQDFPTLAGNEWVEIFGNRIPVLV